MEELFKELGKGKKIMSFKELKNWDLLKDMKASDSMSDKQLKMIIADAGKRKFSLEKCENERIIGFIFFMFFHFFLRFFISCF